MIAGTHGVTVELSLGADISTSTNTQIVIKSPSGITTTVQATIVDAARGTIRYISGVGMFNIVTSITKRHYKLQAKITFADALLKSTIVDLEVQESL